MNKKITCLRWSLIIVGLIFIFGIFPLMMFWPSGWRWEPRQYEYEQMIIGIYATLGVFLLLAAKSPLANLSLIWFTVCSSVVHATIMLMQALYNPSEISHLWGDIPALYIIAVLLAALTPINSSLK